MGYLSIITIDELRTCKRNIIALLMKIRRMQCYQIEGFERSEEFLRRKLEGKKEWRGWQRWIACRVDNPSTTNALINNFLFHGTNLAFVQFLFILILFVDIPLISSGFRLTRFRPSQTRNELIVLWSLSYRLYHTNIRNFASQ